MNLCKNLKVGMIQVSLIIFINRVILLISKLQTAKQVSLHPIMPYH